LSYTEVKTPINLDRVPLSDVVPLDMPYAVYAFPTTYCNFKCVYCAHAIGFEKMREQYNFVPQNMNMDTYCLIIEQMKAFPGPVKLLSLTGQGEPLINKNIVLGNVHTDTLKNMWAGKILHDFWLMQLRGQRSTNPKCAVCVAPDDVSHELDVLDYAAEEIINRMKCVFHEK